MVCQTQRQVVVFVMVVNTHLMLSLVYILYIMPGSRDGAQLRNHVEFPAKTDQRTDGLFSARKPSTKTG